MAITFIDGTTIILSNAWGSASPATVSAPTHLEDDVLIALAQRQTDGNLITAPAGWVQLDQQSAWAAGNIQTAIFYKVATASEPASYSFTVTDASTLNGAVLVASYRGVDTATIFDVVYSSVTDYAEEAATTTPTPPSITTVTNGAFVVATLTKEEAGAITGPAGYTEAANTGGDFRAFGRSGSIFHKEIVTAGLETPPDYSVSSTDAALYTFALRPVVIPAGPTLTGPASAQEGDAINAIGTGLTSATLDLVTTVGGHVGAQVTTGTPTDTTWPYTVNPKTGVPFSVVPIQAAGVTLWVTEQRATDGTSATNTMTIAVAANETVIQGMIATSNTTPGESIFGTNILAMEDNLQANPPTLVSGVTITWFADGTFTVDMNQAISFTVDFFSPSNSEWQSISLNITEAGEITISAANKLSIGIGIGI